MNGQYWESFYATARPPVQPSSFYAFARDYLVHHGYTTGNSLLDIGCGNLRDARAFAEYGYRVTAVDRATTLPSPGHKNIRLLTGYDATRLDLKASIYYCRFFVHALEEAELDTFLRNLHAQMNESSVLFIETRAAEGAEREKKRFRSVVGEAHERMLYSRPYLARKMEQFGFRIDHQEDGRGLAVCNGEDPLVIRIVARRAVTAAEYARHVEIARQRIEAIRTPDFIARQKSLLGLFERAAAFLDDHHVPYWLGYGTLLGYLRHGGLIPWDDDLDLCVDEEGLCALQAIDFTGTGFGFRPLNPVHYHLCPDGSDVGIDIFFNARAETHPKRFWPEEVHPLRRAVFNGIPTYIPHAPLNFLTRRYGITDLNDCVVWNHVTENNYWRADFEPHQCTIKLHDLPEPLQHYILEYS